MIVIGFQDDVVLPAHLGREVADAIPTAATWRFPTPGTSGSLKGRRSLTPQR